MLLNDPSVPKIVREHLSVIQKNATIEAKLTEDLMDVANAEIGKLQLNLRATNVHEVLRTVIETCVPNLEQKQISLSVDLKALNHQLDADADRLQQVFCNLLENASEYTGNTGHILISSSNPESDLLRVEIRDSGKGISGDLITRLFEPFAQGETSEGLGLGLAISKAIVELHGGSIKAISDGPGKGSTFIVELTLGSRFSLYGPAVADGNEARTPKAGM
jgi:signal transduction histidine kinase